MNMTLSYILVIMFWALLALGIVTLLLYVYIQMQYYLWDKENRANKALNEMIIKAMKNTTIESNPDLTNNIKCAKIAESAAPSPYNGSSLSDSTGEIPCGGSKDIC